MNEVRRVVGGLRGLLVEQFAWVVLAGSLGLGFGADVVRLGW